jgi:hypothetical protein
MRAVGVLDVWNCGEVQLKAGGGDPVFELVVTRQLGHHFLYKALRTGQSVIGQRGA